MKAKSQAPANAPDWWTGTAPVKHRPSVRPPRSPGNSSNEVYLSIKSQWLLSRSLSQWGMSKGWRCIINAPFKAPEHRAGFNHSAALYCNRRVRDCYCACLLLVESFGFTMPLMLWEALRLVYEVFIGIPSNDTGAGLQLLLQVTHGDALSLSETGGFDAWALM